MPEDAAYMLGVRESRALLERQPPPRSVGPQNSSSEEYAIPLHSRGFNVRDFLSTTQWPLHYALF